MRLLDLLIARFYRFTSRVNPDFAPDTQALALAVVFVFTPLWLAYEAISRHTGVIGYPGRFGSYAIGGAIILPVGLYYIVSGRLRKVIKNFKNKAYSKISFFIVILLWLLIVACILLVW